MSDESLFREVDEDYRNEQYKKLWERFGKYVIAVCVLVVLGVAGYKYYQYYQLQQAQAASILYFDGTKSLMSGKLDDATKSLSAIQGGGFKQLGKLQEASVLAQQGKIDEAIKHLDAIADDAAIETSLRDTARIRAGYLQVDTLPLDALQAKMDPFMKDGLPWRHAAREIMALSAYRNADYAKTETYLSANLADKDTPGGIRERAGVLMQLIAPKLQ